MSWWNRSAKSASNPISDPKQLETFLLSIANKVTSGVSVNPETAMRCTAVAASVRLLSGSISQLPVHIYETLDSGEKRIAKDHPNYKLLAYRPNNYQTSVQFRQTMQRNFSLHGAAYAKPVRLRDRVLELHPIHPNSVKVKQSDSLDVTYKISLKDGGSYETDDLLVLNEFTHDGVTPVSRVEQAKEAIGLAMAAEKFGATFFSNGAKSTGAWRVPGSLSDDAYSRLKSDLNDGYSGDNAHENPLLEEGLDWVKTGFNAKESQVIELRAHQVVEIARIFGVPPHLIQHLSDATFSNIEHQGRDYLQTSLMPLLEIWESSTSDFLLTDEQREEGAFIEFDVDRFSRGDLAARTAFYNSGIQWGYLNSNEVRSKENMAARDGGDDYLRPVNMVTGNENETNT